MREHYDYHSGLERVKEEIRQGEELKKRSMDEMISYFNQRVSEMNISVEDKMTILALITAIGFKYEEDTKAVHPDNQVHLCDSCSYTYPDCPSVYTDVIFGNGIGNDNICACSKYLPSAQPKKILYRHYKGGIYELVCNGVTHTETDESLVIYRDYRGKLWARPESMFYGIASVGDELVPRFVLYQPQEEQQEEERISNTELDFLKCKKYSKATMMTWSKSQLIEHIRLLEENYDNAVIFNEQQARNIEQMLKDREATE